MAESLAPVVQKLLIANISPAHIKKRSALALLRFFARSLCKCNISDIFFLKIIPKVPLHYHPRLVGLQTYYLIG